VFVDIEAVLKAGHCVEFAREIQSAATAPIGAIANNESIMVPLEALVDGYLFLDERSALLIFSLAIFASKSL